MGTKDCKFCDKQGLLILPLRYAAVVGEAQALADIPALPATLGTGVKDLALTHGKYAPRMVREGYIYLLQERAGIKYWEGYMVVEGAFLYKFDVKSPPTAQVDFSCDRSTCGIDASCIAIDKVEFVSKAWFLFTPSPMTEAKLKEYKDNADSYVGKGKMQAFDPKAWAKSGSKGQEHSLKPELIGQHVAEWILYKQCDKALTSPLGKAMEQQLFVPSSSSFAGVPAIAPSLYQPGRLGVLQGKLVEKEAAAFVMYDHIGIVQELNNHRNAPYAKVDHFMRQQDKAGVTNDHKFAVHHAIEDIKVGIEQSYVLGHQHYLDRMRDQSEQNQETRLGQAKMLRAQGRVAEAEAIEKDVACLRTVRDKNYATLTADPSYAKYLDDVKDKAKTIWPEKYEPLLAKDRKQIVADVDKYNTEAGNQAASRVDTHLLWLKSKRLLNAFDAFDTKHQECGFTFSSHAFLCYFGMDGVPTAEKVLDEWITAATVERDNLFMRAFIYNQDEAKAHVAQAIEAARAAAATAPSAMRVDWGHAVKGAKSLIDYMKKADSAWDEWARTGPDGRKGNAWQVKGFDTQTEGRILSKCSSITRSVFKLGLGNRGDKFIVTQLSTLLYSKVGSLAEKLRFEEMMYRIDPQFPFPVEEDASLKKSGKADELKKRAPSNANLPPTSANGTPRNLDPEAARTKAINAREGVQKTLDDALKHPDTSNYHQIRMGTVIAGLEAINLMMQAKELFKDGEITLDDKLKVIGASLALASSAYDLAYTGAKVIREQADWLAASRQITGTTQNAIRGAGESTRGGLKLMSGTLSMGAGFIGAYFDIKAFISEKNDSSLMIIYLLRGSTSAVGSVLNMAAAFSYSGLFLTRLAIKHSGSRTLAGLLMNVGQKAAVWAARVRLLTLVARVNLAGLLLTAGEIVYRVFFMDNQMEKWCKQCAFRSDKTVKPFGNNEKELETLQQAFVQKDF
jgi:hypothetical protein